MTAPRFRLSRNYNRFYTGHKHDLSFRVYRWDDDPTVRDWEPEALGGYTSVLFQVYSADADTVLLKNESLTVQSGAGELEGGVANKATGTVTFTSAASNVRCKLVLRSSTDYRVVDAEWEADIYVGGPTT